MELGQLSEWFEDGSSGMSSTPLSLGFLGAKAKTQQEKWADQCAKNANADVCSYRNNHGGQWPPDTKTLNEWVRATKQAQQEAKKAAQHAVQEANKAAQAAKQLEAQAARTGDAGKASAAAMQLQKAQALAQTAATMPGATKQQQTALTKVTTQLNTMATKAAGQAEAIATGAAGGASTATAKQQGTWQKQCERNPALAVCIFRTKVGRWPNSTQELNQWVKANKATVTAQQKDVKAAAKAETQQERWETQCAKNAKLAVCVYKATMGAWPASQQALNEWSRTAEGKAAVQAIKTTAQQTKLEDTWEKQCAKNNALAQCVYKAKYGKWPTKEELAAFKKSVEGKADIKTAKLAKKLANGKSVEVTAKEAPLIDKLNEQFSALKSLAAEVRQCAATYKDAKRRKECADKARARLAQIGAVDTQTSMKGLALSGLSEDATQPSGLDMMTVALQAKCIKNPMRQQCIALYMSQQTQQMVQAMLDQMTQLTQLIMDLINQLSQGGMGGECYDENGNVIACVSGDGSTGTLSTEGNYGTGGYSAGGYGGGMISSGYGAGGYGAGVATAAYGAGMVSSGYGAAGGDITGDGIIAGGQAYGGQYGASMVSEDYSSGAMTSQIPSALMQQQAYGTTYGLDVAGDGYGGQELAMQSQPYSSYVPSGVGDEALPAAFFQQEVLDQSQGYAPGGEDMDLYAMADQYAMTPRAVTQTTVQPSGVVLTEVVPPQGLLPVSTAIPAQFAMPAPIVPAEAAEAAQDDSAILESFFAPEPEFAEDDLGMSQLFPAMQPLVGPSMITPTMPVFATAASEPKAEAEEGAELMDLFGATGDFAGEITADQEELFV